MKIFKGIGASEGIALAKVFVLEEIKFDIKDIKIKKEDVKKEIDKVELSFSNAITDLEKIKEMTSKKMGESKAAVFEAHIQIVNDPELKKQIIDMIDNDLFNGAYAINTVFNTTHDIFASMDNPYFKERASDIVDVSKRILAHFLNKKLPDLFSINEEVVIVANDLTPSQTAILDKKYVKGFLTNIGGRTSHAAIMARTMEIPAVLGLKNITENVNNNDLIALDGTLGVAEVKPSSVEEWKNKILIFEKEKKELQKYVSVKTKTLDGHTVDVEANVGKPSDADNLKEYGAEGVGLYRSEFLYMENDHWPTEDEQFQAYKYVLEKNPNHLVIVRTLDIGGDKKLNYFSFEHEDNPFLGYRAIRFSLDRKDIFKTQLRALIKASKFGKLGIMFPMISNVDEFIEAKKFTLDCIEEIKKEKIEVKEIKIGMMVEIPSSAILIDKFAEHADFFSIGTNDLIQYSFAIDRMSQKVSNLYQPNNPALLRLIEIIIRGAKTKNRPVGMCGEMAGDIMSIPILLGLGEKGLDAFSMSSSSILRAKKIICNLKHSECIKLADEAVKLSTTQEVNQLVTKFLKSKKLI